MTAPNNHLMDRNFTPRENVTSILMSPASSRDSSPAPFLPSSGSVSRDSRTTKSRKNSADPSPTRKTHISITSSSSSSSAVPLPTTFPTSQTQSNGNFANSKIPRTGRSNSIINNNADGTKETPTWPISPRLKSPSPSTSSSRNLSASRRTPIENNNAAPNIVIRSPIDASMDSPPSTTSDSESTSQSQSDVRKPSTNTIFNLEPVQESTTPLAVMEINPLANHKPDYFAVISDEDQQPTQIRKDVSPSRPVAATRNMTVETEIVNSIPQAALATIETKSSGTLRVKASNETIRPKKDRKKPSKKTASVTSTTAPSTRSEVFENRVKKAMEDASSDDSDETFVGANLANAISHDRSQSKPERVRPSHKRSMKFSSATSNYGTADEDVDPHSRPKERNGSHFGGRVGRSLTGHAFLLDDENPLFPSAAAKNRSLTAVGGRGSSTRLQKSRASSTKRADGYASLDIETEGADDDERTPLILGTGTVRTPRRTARNARYRDGYYRQQPRRRNVIVRFAGCLLLLITLSVLVSGVVCFLFALSKPLEHVKIIGVNNVIASEQVLMFDMVVEAINPNLVAITVSNLDVNCFAKSEYVGTQKWWRDHGHDSNILLPEPSNGEDLHRLDLEEPLIGNKTMLLGPITKFDAPLLFDASFFPRKPSYSVGSVRLYKPGNHSEAGGTDRWERAIKHDFVLDVRGILSYTIPLGGKIMNSAIHANVTVKGNTDEDKKT